MKQLKLFTVEQYLKENVEFPKGKGYKAPVIKQVNSDVVIGIYKGIGKNKGKTIVDVRNKKDFDQQVLLYADTLKKIVTEIS